MASINDSPRHYPPHPSSRPIGIRPEIPFPRHPQSHTPPYTSADELRSHPSRPMMMPRPSYPTFYGGGPSGSSNAPSWMDPRHLPGTPQPQHLSPSQFGSSAPESFTFYPPTLFPHSPYITQPFTFTPTATAVDADTDGETDLPPSPKAVDSEVKPKFVKPPPRPPNAWIIYRSDMLRAIAKGDPMPKLDAAMAEAGISSSESPNDDAVDSSDKDAESGGRTVPKKKVKKPKKGAKEPTAGMLSLGKGKTGRGIPQADVSKLISLMWAREEPEVKKKYENQSAQHKKEHQQKYPNYKFQPLKRADKLRLREERERQKAEEKVQKQASKQAEKQAATGHNGPKRKGRSRVPAPSPYAAAMARTKSGSVEVKEEPGYSMYPFPIPQDALPSLQGEFDAPDSKRSPMPPPPAPLMYPAWADMPDLGPAYAVPYIFEPIPIPGDEFNIDLLQPLGEGGDADADALAALWCSVEEEEVEPGATWDMTSSEAMQAWSELGSFPPYPANVELSSSIAEQIAQDWTANLPPNYASNMQPIYDPTLDMIQIPYYNPYAQYAAPAEHGAAPGPFLSANQPLSPVEPWSSQGNPDAMPFRLMSTGSNRIASSSHTDHLSPDHGIPRYVSSSAFPSSLSVESGGWTDRSVSFSAFAAQMSGEEDGLLWDEEVERDGRKGMEFGGGHSPKGAPVERDTPDTEAKGPPRNIRRARTVGAKFAESS